MKAPPRARVFQIALVLTAVFNVLALLVLVTGHPVVFAVFMFGGQALFVTAMTFLLAAVVTGLRARDLL